jgi:hypothetical protein
MPLEGGKVEKRKAPKGANDGDGMELAVLESKSAKCHWKEEK